MFPIYEQGDGHGIGMGLQDFPWRFEEILASHAVDRRATAFAFIFYDFKDDQRPGSPSARRLDVALQALCLQATTRHESGRPSSQSHLV